LKNILYFKNQYIESKRKEIQKFSKNGDIEKLHLFFIENDIDTHIDQDIIKPYTIDWSNIPGGFAEMLVRPTSIMQCGMILKTCQLCKIPITISAGQTNLTGSATPNGGVVLSTQRLTSPDIAINIKNKTVLAPVGIPLEIMRNEILKKSHNKLYYPVDPTSRNDALVGGTLSCNASGFVPGEKGATRYWVEEIEFMLINGFSLKIIRGKYLSKDGQFIIDCNGDELIIPVPSYKRPKIKNASGPYSALNEEIDFIDLIIGSEGIFGMITSCKFNLANKPKDFLELFIRLKNENKAIEFHHYLYNYFKHDMSKVTALEYFGYNCQHYMKHKSFLFNNDEEVGIYVQVPIYNSTQEEKMLEWISLLEDFDLSIDLDNVISLNDPFNWKRFFEARHSIPDNALTKTRKLGGVSLITDTIVPLENFKEYLNKIHMKLQNEKIEYLLFGHLGDCHLHFHLIPSKKQDQLCLDIYDYMIDLSTQLDGVYSAEHGTGKRKRNDFKKCYGIKAVQMIRASKLAIDPDFLLNKGNVID